jgi:hypothetical protein
MDKQNLKVRLKEFKDGDTIISIHEKYEDVFQKYLKLNNIKVYWKEKKHVYINYRTSSLGRVELRNSEIRHLKQINKEIRLKEISALKQLLTEEEWSLKGGK